MKFSQTARNQPAPPATAQVPSGAGGVATTPAAGTGPGAAGSDNFVQLLAQSEPQQQKQIIGEQLYRQIYTLHPELTGKITGKMINPEIFLCVQCGMEMEGHCFVS